MKRKISPNDCKNMFSDKLNSLSMKELGIELKHFAIGTAPEYPSFLANQDNLKKILVEKFSNFFDWNRSQGLEVIYLKSNYGNGKSHFIRTIHSFMNNFENVLAKKVSLKQEKTDLKIKILEGIGQKIIKDTANFLVKVAAVDSLADEKESILLTLSEKYNISPVLSDLIYQAARNQEISKQSQAIAILKGNTMASYLKSFGLRRSDLNNEFYLDVIRVICEYLYECDFYMVIVFDEYEHIYSWKDAQARKAFFQDIKLFTDSIDTYKNLFFVFAESESVDNASEDSDDPAYVSRKKASTYQIANISSEFEVQKLLKMIKARYERYYEISLDQYLDDILESIKNDEQVKTNSNYRTYTQVIIRILDEYRNRPQKSRKAKKSENVSINDKENTVNDSSSGNIDICSKWESSTSISKKTILCDALEYLLSHSNEKILNLSKKRGVCLTQKEQEKIEYHIFVTSKPSSSDFIKRYNDALRIRSETEVTKVIMLYPYKHGVNDEFNYENVIFYNVDKVPNILKEIYSDTSVRDDVLSCLKALEERC